MDTDKETVRYVVLDTSGDWEPTEVAGHRGTVLGRFRSEESARALALQRLAYGDRGVIVVDSAAGEVVYPPGHDARQEASAKASGTRRKVDVAHSADHPAQQKARRGPRR
jgi:hypothetical protein